MSGVVIEIGVSGLLIGGDFVSIEPDGIDISHELLDSGEAVVGAEDENTFDELFVRRIAGGIGSPLVEAFKVGVGGSNRLTISSHVDVP